MTKLYDAAFFARVDAIGSGSGPLTKDELEDIDQWLEHPYVCHSPLPSALLRRLIASHPRSEAPCSTAGCSGFARWSGACPEHYWQMKAQGQEQQNREIHRAIAKLKEQNAALRAQVDAARAEERESCAKIIDLAFTGVSQESVRSLLVHLAESIRARAPDGAQRPERGPAIAEKVLGLMAQSKLEGMAAGLAEGERREQARSEPLHRAVMDYLTDGGRCTTIGGSGLRGALIAAASAYERGLSAPAPRSGGAQRRRHQRSG